ncbi:tetratricopeptide repeat protein [Dyadobacter sp. CY327]|uniref:tetratricopeptide repeat protein n=1 Tax=Dyadobacter sp. CY327 TaxID=2907301 RepID=UPI001F1B722B|nr:tetratricopeptide repeat protein [Dyadobacter sp. CY327]MCE7072616.1 tetratricopeptide repeat protein [Dyadobacter sp. CY327]
MFNKHQISNIYINGSNNLVIQCATGEELVHPISELIERLTESHTKRISDLESAIIDKTEINNYNKREINELGEELAKERYEKEALTKKVEDLLRTLSNKDFSKLSDAHKESINLLIQGNVKGAINALNDLTMDSALAEIEDSETQLADKKRKICEALFFKSQLLIIENDFDAALDNALKAVKVCPTLPNFINAINLSYIAEKFDKCNELIAEALLISSDNNDLSQILYYKGMLALRLSHFGVAKETLEKAIEITSGRDDETLDRICQLYSSFAELEKSDNEEKKAEDLLMKSLEIQRDLVSRHPQNYLSGLADSLKKMAKHYVDNNRYEQAIPLYDQSLQLYLSLVSSSKHYLVSLAGLYNEMGVLYRRLGSSDDSKKFYDLALELTEDPSFHTVSARVLLGNLRNNLGVLYLNSGNLPNAERAFSEALKIRREISAVNPDAYWRSLIESLVNVANVKTDLELFGNAKENYLECLAIIEGYNIDKLPHFENTIALIKHNLAGVYLLEENYLDAEKMCSKVYT